MMNKEEILEFLTDPLRLTLIIAGAVVLLVILLAGRRSRKNDLMYGSSSLRKDYDYESADDRLLDEEVIVLPRRKKESEVNAEAASEAALKAENHFSAHFASDPDEPTKESHSQTNLDVLVDTFSEVPEVTFAPEKTESIQIKQFEKDQSTHVEEKTQAPKFSQTPNSKAPISKTSNADVTQASNADVTQASNANANAKATQVPATNVKTIKSDPIKTQTDNTEPKTQQFVVLHIIAVEGVAFTGKAIFDAIQSLGMAMGKHNVFHYPADAAFVGDSAFCLTNMSAEGNFDLEKLEELETNGVSLILTLPTLYSDGVTVFSNMLAVAQAFSKRLGGEIIDQTRMPLTPELVKSIRADILKFERQFEKNPV